MRSFGWVAVLLGACADGGDGTAEADFEASAVAADVPGVAFVTVTADEAGDAWVTPPSGIDSAHGTLDGGGSVEMTVLGLRAGEQSDLVVHFDGEASSGTKTVPVTTLPPPVTAPAFTVTPVTDAACDPGGYLLFSYLGDSASGVGIVDREGRYVWGVDSAVSTDGPAWAAGKVAQVSRARPGRDGHSILWNYADPEREEDYAGTVRLSLDGRTRVDTRTLNGHHDFVELPDGRIGWLAYEFQDMPKSEVEGAPAEAPDPMYVATDAIYEADEGNTSDTGHDVVWSMLEDDYPIYWAGDTMRCMGEFLGDGTCEFSHGNSLMFRDSDEAYFAMFRWTDVLVKVPRATGTLAWQMGGRDTEDDFSFAAEEDAFTHSHMSELWEGGMLVYDNRIEAELPVGEGSRLLEYSFDEAALTCSVVWEYISDRHDNLLGDVRRMPVAGCDNVIVAWSQQGRVVEMTRDGVEVWELSTPIGTVVSRVFYLPSLYDMSTGLAP